MQFIISNFPQVKDLGTAFLASLCLTASCGSSSEGVALLPRVAVSPQGSTGCASGATPFLAVLFLTASCTKNSIFCPTVDQKMMSPSFLAVCQTQSHEVTSWCLRYQKQCGNVPQQDRGYKAMHPILWARNKQQAGHSNHQGGNYVRVSFSGGQDNSRPSQSMFFTNTFD